MVKQNSQVTSNDRIVHDLCVFNFKRRLYIFLIFRAGKEMKHLRVISKSIVVCHERQNTEKHIGKKHFDRQFK